MASPSWGLDKVTRQLRKARNDWRNGHRKADVAEHRLPSVIAVEHIVERIEGALYPQRLGNFGGQGPEEDAYVAGELRNALSALLHQLNFEPAVSVDRSPSPQTLDTGTILGEFAASLPAIRRLIDGDVEAAQSADPFAGSVDEILLSATAPIAILRYRLAHRLHTLGAPLIARIVARTAYALTGIYIHPAARIGSHFVIEHGSGTIIGATAKIGAHVRLHQGVTLGDPQLANPVGSPPATASHGPVLEDHVVIHAGATIMKGITVGTRSVVGPNVSLTQSVPADSIIVQASGLSHARSGG